MKVLLLPSTHTCMLLLYILIRLDRAIYEAVCSIMLLINRIFYKQPHGVKTYSYVQVKSAA
jgi:hypothetical protein